MKNKYPFFKYVVGDSKVHLMNSKMKIIFFLLFLLNVLLLRDYISLGIIVSIIFFLILSSKIPLLAYLSNILLIWPIYIIIFLLTYFLSFNFSLSILVVSKIIIIISLLLVLTFTTSLSEIAWGFECTFSKLKKINIPVSKISLRIAMDIKFIATLFEQSREVRKSMAYRGIPYNQNSLMSFKKMIIPVISLSYKLSRRMAKIMKLRFYGSSKRRTNYHENKITIFDKLLIALSLVILYVIVWLGWV